MTFIHPLLLAGTALAALPIVLHLIMRRKARHFEFPALRLVERKHQTNRRQLRLRHLVLLALRIAAIAILALALARPSLTWSSMGSQEAPVAAALVFDTAPRMEYRHENRTRLEAAEELGTWLIAQLPEQSQIAVLDAKPGPGVFQVDRGAAKQRVGRLESTAHAQPLPRVMDEAARLLATSDRPRKEAYVFTDLARVAWPADSAAQIRRLAAEVPNLSIYLIDVGIEQPNDFALGELRLSGQVLSSRSPLQIQTELNRLGPAGDRMIELYLLDAQRQPQKRDQRSASTVQNGSAQVEFQVGSLEVGTHQGFVQIAGQDGLPADDVRFFTVQVQPPWKILVAAPNPAERHALFLAEALAPSDFRRSGQARFDCKIIALADLAKETLDSYAAVCMLDPTPLEPSVWQKLADFTTDGGGVGIFLGRNATPVDSFNRPPAQDLLPGTLVRQARRPEGDLALAPRELQHPVLAPFRELAGSIPWKAFPVYRYWQLGPLAKGVGVIVPLGNGQPSLLERPVGRGRAVTMTTPISDAADQTAWNLLPVGQSWPFLILANQTVLYLTGGSEAQWNYYAGQTVTVPLAEDDRRRAFLLTAPGDVKSTIAVDPKAEGLVVTATDQPGNYWIQAGGQETGITRGFSVNLTPNQTRLERLSADELADLFGKVKFRLARNRDQIDRDVSQERVGRELFPLLIILLAVVLGAEHLLANRFYRE